jgi:hypothetical protein
MRGAGPVLLLVLAVALGTMAIGQSDSWSRSQGDQADFRTGAPVRVTAPAETVPGRTDRYAAVPGVAEAAPAARTTMSLSGDRTATVLALDTSRVADTMLMRSDLADEPLPDLLSGLAPGRPSAGARVPAGTAALSLTATLAGWDVGTPLGDPGDTGPGSGRSPAGMAADVTVTVEDRWGTPYRLRADRLAADGREHTLTMDVSSGPLTLTGVELVMIRPTGDGEQHRLTVREVTATSADGTARRVRLPGDWTGQSEVTGPSLGPAEGPRARSPRWPVSRCRCGPPPRTVPYGCTAAGGTWCRPVRPGAVRSPSSRPWRRRSARSSCCAGAVRRALPGSWCPWRRCWWG